MQKIVKKGIAVLLVVVLAVVLQVQGFAVLGTLPYWESDSDWICRWGTSYRNIPMYAHINKMNANDRFYFTQGFDHAFIQWGATLNRSFSRTASTVADIRFYGGTKYQIDQTGIFNYAVGGELGLTNISTIPEGSWTYKNTTKTGRKITGVKGYVVDYLGRSIQNYKNTCAHEFGHALGWDGHTWDKNSVMYPTDGYDPLYLSNIDKRHLVQVYK